MPNSRLRPKYAKICGIKNYIFITIVIKMDLYHTWRVFQSIKKNKNKLTSPGY